MSRSGNVTIFSHQRPFPGLSRAFAVFAAFCLSFSVSYAQNGSGNEKIVSFEDLLKRPVAVRPELKGVHPRLFFTAGDIAKFRERARGKGNALWVSALKDIETLKRDTPDPKDEDLYKSGLDKRKPGSISQYGFAFQIAETSFAYAIEQDERYFAAARKWTLEACEMPIWGYTYNKPNVDLPPAHLLYAVAFAYDLLYDKFTPDERAIIRNKLVKQGRLMYDYFKFKRGKRYTFSQNHTWIPMAGLAIAAYAIIDVVDEAKDWAQLARAVFDRTMLTMGTDGFFYESFHYFGFAFRWTIRYFDAHKHVTGEDLYVPMRSKFAGMKYFAMHSILPDGKNVFDFGDVGDGALNRNGTSKREALYGEYDIIYRLAGVYRDEEAQTVADYIANDTKLETREPMWAFINRDPELKAAPLSRIPLEYRFDDNDTVFWRSDWTRTATAFAFRCAPPEGHHAARLASRIPDWRENTGHAHPDANSFIIWANGRYLTGDTGYLGIKQTDDHNTILVDGRGQEKDGNYEMFKDVPNERLDRMRIAEYWANPRYFHARGEAAPGYYTELDVKKLDRNFLYVASDYFVVWDELETGKPSKFTFLLNADREASVNGNSADLTNDDTILRILRILPVDAESKVVPQMIRARGLPGSVDKGDTEQRGLQLQTTTAAPSAKANFLHFFQVLKRNDTPASPVVSPLGQNATGLRIAWPTGDTEFVCLAGTCGGVSSDSTRTIVRISGGENWKRLIWQNGTGIKLGDKPLFEASKPLSGALGISASGRLSGYLNSASSTRIKLVIPIKMNRLLIDGVAAKIVRHDGGSMSLEIPAGTHFIESE